MRTLAYLYAHAVHVKLPSNLESAHDNSSRVPYHTSILTLITPAHRKSREVCGRINNRAKLILTEKRNGEARRTQTGMY